MTVEKRQDLVRSVRDQLQSGYIREPANFVPHQAQRAAIHMNGSIGAFGSRPRQGLIDFLANQVDLAASDAQVVANRLSDLRDDFRVKAHELMADEADAEAD